MSGVSNDKYSMCEICGRFGHRAWPNGLVQDHCHKTRKNRGILCRPCNNGLGFFQDDVEQMALVLECLGARSSYVFDRRRLDNSVRKAIGCFKGCEIILRKAIAYLAKYCENHAELHYYQSDGTGLCFEKIGQG